MSAGITSYSTYIPRHRLSRKAVAAAWVSSAAPGCKAVVHFDEDSLTMAQSAAWRLLASTPAPERLYFASTSSPYWQRSVSSLIAAHCDLPPGVATADFGGSLRCGTAALRAALDSGQRALVVAAEAREGRPESAEEMAFGDAAGAISIGSDGVIAEVVGWTSRADDFLDEWRREVDPYVTSFASKFSTTRGYQANVVEAAREVLAGASTKVSRAVLASPDGTAHLDVARALAIPPERVEETRVADIGVTGAAMPLLLLAHALDRAAPGELILVASYGDGADAFLLRVTAEIARLPRPLLRPDAWTIEYPSYEIYRKLRGFLRTSAEAAEVSNVLWEREETQNVRLRGTVCPRCKAVQFPMTKVCIVCRNSDGLTEQPLARTGRLFTFTKDYLYDAPVQPTVMAIVELEGGGRLLCQMTDVDEQKVEIGMPVELVLRRMRESPSMHHYYWKCRPVWPRGEHEKVKIVPGEAHQ